MPVRERERDATRTRWGPGLLPPRAGLDASGGRSIPSIPREDPPAGHRIGYRKPIRSVGEVADETGTQLDSAARIFSGKR